MQRLLRFTLDLFEREPVPAPPVADTAPVPPVAPVQRTAPPVLPTQTLEQALAPATFRHPQATREILLGSCLVAYAFRRGKRRTIGFSVGPDGLTVTAPGWAPLRDVDTALREKSDWIVRKLGEMRERGERMETARITWHDGTVLPFLGAPLRVVLDPRHTFAAAGAQLVAAGADENGGDDGTVGQTLYVPLPHTATPDDTALWFNYDWPKALKAGAEATGKPYSGEFDFVKTEMLWPTTHMVAPAKDAVACASCHTSAAKSRLGDLPGVYLPARDSQPWIDRLGWLAVIGALAGVLLHAGVRIFSHQRTSKGKHHD